MGTWAPRVVVGSGESLNFDEPLIFLNQPSQTKSVFSINLSRSCFDTPRDTELTGWCVALPSYWHPIVVVGGLIQTALYCDFLYYYIKAKSKSLDEPVKVQVDAGIV